MIRVYFVFEDPLDDSGVNLSYVDVPTSEQGEALRRVVAAASSGRLWQNLYPEDEEHPYKLIEDKMTCMDVSALRGQHRAETTLV